jgi:hypothetical protein
MGLSLRPNPFVDILLTITEVIKFSCIYPIFKALDFLAVHKVFATFSVSDLISIPLCHPLSHICHIYGIYISNYCAHIQGRVITAHLQPRRLVKQPC